MTGRAHGWMWILLFTWLPLPASAENGKDLLNVVASGRIGRAAVEERAKGLQANFYQADDGCKHGLIIE